MRKEGQQKVPLPAKYEKALQKLIHQYLDFPKQSDEPIHEFFGLSYAQFLVLSRTALQSMPLEWQKRFVTCLLELEREIPDMDPDWPWQYHVTVRNIETKKFGSLKDHDKLGGYDRGRKRVKLNSEKE